MQACFFLRDYSVGYETIKGRLPWGVYGVLSALIYLEKVYAAQTFSNTTITYCQPDTTIFILGHAGYGFLVCWNKEINQTCAIPRNQSHNPQQKGTHSIQVHFNNPNSNDASNTYSGEQSVYSHDPLFDIKLWHVCLDQVVCDSIRVLLTQGDDSNLEER